MRYDSSKPAFLKIDWSDGGMGYILMQADESYQSLAALTFLEATGDYTFNLSLDSPRLRPVFFGSRFNQNFGVHCHSFVDEVTYGR